ncbi:unnamed protein product [Chrysoparadoxa australica]
MKRIGIGLLLLAGACRGTKAKLQEVFSCDEGSSCSPSEVVFSSSGGSEPRHGFYRQMHHILPFGKGFRHEAEFTVDPRLMPEGVRSFRYEVASGWDYEPLGNLFSNFVEEPETVGLEFHLPERGSKEHALRVGAVSCKRGSCTSAPDLDEVPLKMIDISSLDMGPFQVSFSMAFDDDQLEPGMNLLYKIGDDWGVGARLNNACDSYTDRCRVRVFGCGKIILIGNICIPFFGISYASSFMAAHPMHTGAITKWSVSEDEIPADQ